MNDYRPKGWTPKDPPTIWIDPRSGYGLTTDGNSVRARIGDRRKKPNLVDLLETAATFGAERVMLTGKTLEPAPGASHWLFAKTPKWTPGEHWIRPGSSPTGRFTDQRTGHRVEIRTVEEWFGDMPLTPAQAREAWVTLAELIKQAEPRAGLMKTPAATGTNLWAWSLPKSLDLTPIDSDIAAELHATSGQHHLEHLVAGKNFSFHDDCVPLVDAEQTKRISAFAHVDGRFMYAALGRELGVGPGRRLNRAAAWAMLEDEPHARARYKVRFGVPRDWNHVGILGVQHENLADGWYYPNRPGAEGTTWADAAEIHVARNAGWFIEPLEAVEFKKAKPLDVWRDRMIRMRERVGQNRDLHPQLRRALEVALRSITIQAIGALASSGGQSTRVAESALEVPAQYQHTMQRQGDVFIYREPSPRSERSASLYHPELAVQIWGRGRARVLEAPTALGNATGGALTLDPSTLLGINGDAIYTTSLPSWSLPVSRGGGDDGKTGRLRLQGYMAGTFLTPASLESRDALKSRADKAYLDDPTAAWAAAENQSS